MLKRIVHALWLTAVFTAVALMLVVGMAAHAAPNITLGLDAQPTINFADAALFGNAIHRYDDGPQHNVPIKAWLDALTAKGLKCIVQGTKLDAAGLNPKDFPCIIAVAQDDEPDLNRANPNNPDVYTAANAPHPSNIGWTRAEVLEARYKNWKAKWPGVEIVVNFAGPNLNNVFYQTDLRWHARYIKASDSQGFDVYPKNSRLTGELYWLPQITEKLRVTGNPTDTYIECSDQKLGTGRGPTANEQGTLVWAALGHGVKRIWYFPQQINGGFSYNAMTPANRARAVDDYATITKYDALLGLRPKLVAQTPTGVFDYVKGKVVLPVAETFEWSNGVEKLTVGVDYVGGTAPVITYAGPTPPTTKPVDPPTDLSDIKARLDAIEAWMRLVQGK